MALFLGVHKLEKGMTVKEAEEGFERYKASARSTGLNPISTVVSLEKGFAYCQTEADSAQQVKDAHEEAEIPIEDVIEVKKLD